MLYALLAQRIYLFLQFGNDIALNGNHARRRKAQYPVLHQDITDNQDQLTAKKQGVGKRDADEAAQRLDLRRDHRNEFALADLFEMRGRKSQYARIQLVPKAP